MKWVWIHPSSFIHSREESVMVRSTRLLLAAALLAATASRAGAQATTPATPPPVPGPAAASEPDFLQGFPRPPDAPGSLMAPPPPPGPPAPDLERPYFEPDPLLDPPQLGVPGWFIDVDAAVVKPHLVNEESQPVTFANGGTFTVGVNAVPMNWTVSPTVEVGYRLPSGFGGIAVSWRGLTAQGSQGAIGADGPATLSSRLEYNIGTVDWISNEFTPWQWCEMRVRFGLRYFNDYYDSQATEPFAEAAAGTTIFNQKTTNSSWQVGPHAEVDLWKNLNFWGLSIMSQLDLTEGWGRVRQGYYASSTTPSELPQAVAVSAAPSKDPPASASFTQGTSDAMPLIFVNLGLRWQPPALPNSYLFLGGQLDYFWNTGRMGNLTTFSYFFDSGAVLQFAINY
jgi:hypothetical protein